MRALHADSSADGLQLQSALAETFRAAKRYFRSLITLDVVLACVATSNAVVYMQSEKAIAAGEMWAAVLMLFLVVDVALAFLLWKNIPIISKRSKQAEPFETPVTVMELSEMSWSAHSCLAKWNFAFNVGTTLVYSISKVMMTDPSDFDLNFWRSLVIFAMVRSIKLIPLFRFWDAVICYDLGEPDKLRKWQPNKSEEYAATAIEWLIIIGVGSLLLVLGTLTCYLYLNGGSWADVMHGPKETALPSWLEAPPSIQGPGGLQKPQPSWPSLEALPSKQGSSGRQHPQPSWLESPPSMQESSSLTAPGRRLDSCTWQYLHGFSAKCCCSAKCPSGVEIHVKDWVKYKRVLKKADDAGEVGFEIGGALGPGVVGTGLTYYLGVEVGAGVALGGPLGALGGLVLGAAAGAISAAVTKGHEVPIMCIKKCWKLDSHPPGCFCKST